MIIFENVSFFGDFLSGYVMSAYFNASKEDKDISGRSWTLAEGHGHYRTRKDSFFVIADKLLFCC